MSRVFLSKLQRPSLFNFTFQQTRKKIPKVKEETIALHKEKKRLKMINTFSSDFTGERAPEWVDAKRLRLFVQAYQKYRNTHRLTVNIEEKDKKELEEITKEYNEKCYYEYLSEKKMLENLHNNFKNAIEECENLPINLKNEIFSEDKAFFEMQDILPESHYPFHLYFEQLMRIFPEETTNKWLLAHKLSKIVQQSLKEN